MAGAVADLAVAGRLAIRAIGRRLRSEVEPAPDLQAFTDQLEAVLAKAPDSVVRDYRWVGLPASQPPWVPADLVLEAGDQVSYFAAGRVYANHFLDIYVQPALQLWCKIGDRGEVFRGTRNSHTFCAETSGPLLLGNYFPNDWADPQGGRLQDDSVYNQVTGELRVLVIRWAGSAMDGLRALRDSGDPGGHLQAEIERLEQADNTPEGWHYLWHLGPAEIYQARQAPDGSACIHCQTQGNVGILQRDVDLRLDSSCEVSWRWCVEQIPSRLREDTVPSHDYLSLAVEFDNGRDITYYWSRSLPVGTGYDCPLPNWAGREFHVVVRSGTDGLGEWHAERRNLFADYARYMGTPPARIVRIWLIANSIFQRGCGRCDYADILLHSREDTVRIL